MEQPLGMHRKGPERLFPKDWARCGNIPSREQSRQSCPSCNRFSVLLLLLSNAEVRNDPW